MQSSFSEEFKTAVVPGLAGAPQATQLRIVGTGTLGSGEPRTFSTRTSAPSHLDTGAAGSRTRLPPPFLARQPAKQRPSDPRRDEWPPAAPASPLAPRVENTQGTKPSLSRGQPDPFPRVCRARARTWVAGRLLYRGEREGVSRRSLLGGHAVHAPWREPVVVPVPDRTRVGQVGRHGQVGIHGQAEPPNHEQAASWR